MRALLRVASFPLIFFGSIAAAQAWLAVGGASWLVVAAVTAVAFGLVIALERIDPYRPAWNHSVGDLRTDILHLVISAWAVESIPLVLQGAVAAGSARLSDALGSRLWPGHWPLLVQLLLALLVTQLTYYWLHRAQHNVRWLWRLHAVHHSSERLYWLNATRVHPIDGLMSAVTTAPMLVLLGVPGPVIALHAVAVGVFRATQHANIDFRLGPLNHLFSSTEVHRWHHSTELDEANANYGSLLLVWDWIFGTRRATRAASAPARLGPHDLEGFPTGYLAQLTSPLSRTLWLGGGDDRSNRNSR